MMVSSDKADKAEQKAEEKIQAANVQAQMQADEAKEEAERYINQRLADATEWPVLYKPMLALVARKYLNGSGDVVSFKMKCEPYLYWPVQLRELKVNSLLKQNPAYNVEEMYSKN
jgi:hypothetical protein